MIPETMNAIQLSGPGDFSLVHVPVPKPGPYELLCRVESVTICGTDPHIIHGDFPGFWPPGYPFIPGHEWAGVVVEADPLAREFGYDAGDRVCGISHSGCGYCDMCLSGRFTLCRNYGNHALNHRQYGHTTQGAYAQFIRTTIKSVAAIPDDMDFDVAAMMDPLSIALHMVQRSGLKAGEDILINGTGPQGLFSILLARHMGAGRVIATGSGFRLEIAEKLGAIPVNYRTEQVVERVLELTAGRGAPRVLECAGTPAGARTACDVVAKGGRIAMVGIPPEGDALLPVKKLVLDEIDLVGCRANPNTLEQAIRMVAENNLDMKSFLTHRFPLRDFEKALDIFVHRRENSLKIAIKPNAR
ncbi:MAG: alcohol dehydrogenase [Spirochaetaceae bacterium]|nr:MAG: alcohol dehydrogenase [Spirochaetaceae bacterium]